MVSNRHRSETTLEVNGKVYHLLFTHHALALMEELLGRSILEIGAQLTYMRFGFRETNAAVLAGLEGWRRKHAPGTEAWTMSRVTDLLDDLEDGTQAREVARQAIEHASERMFPDLLPSEDDGDPKAMTATGGSPTSE